MEAEPEDILEVIPEEADSYDELAAVEPPPQKRGRGRPKGSRNKPKIEKEEEVEEIEEIPSPPPTPPPTPKPKTRKSRAKPQPIPVPPHPDVEFEEGYGGAGPPKKAVRMRKPVSVKPRAREPRAQSVPRETDLMHVLAAFAKEHGTIL